MFYLLAYIIARDLLQEIGAQGAHRKKIIT